MTNRKRFAKFQKFGKSAPTRRENRDFLVTLDLHKYAALILF
jgi:hypothetical protein